MERMLEELDYRDTSMGELVLRRRRSLSVPGTIVYEVKLDDECLMSSLVSTSEEALATIPLGDRSEDGLAVLVGGLGLGHTAVAALAYANVVRVDVVEYLEPVVDWHERRLVPAADTLMDDPRCTLIAADFFEALGGGDERLAEAYDAILLDIDHAPEALLDPRHEAFYSESGMNSLQRRLAAGGVFALWSVDEPGASFVDAVRAAFPTVTLHPVSFVNPNFHREEEHWILVADERESPDEA